MPFTSRREFMKRAALSTGVVAAPAVRVGWGRSSPNERINVGVVGFRNRGRDHYRAFAGIADVRVAYLCDVDERLFPPAIEELEKAGGYKPRTFASTRESCWRRRTSMPFRSRPRIIGTRFRPYGPARPAKTSMSKNPSATICSKAAGWSRRPASTTGSFRPG